MSTIKEWLTVAGLIVVFSGALVASVQWLVESQTSDITTSVQHIESTVAELHETILVGLRPIGERVARQEGPSQSDRDATLRPGRTFQYLKEMPRLSKGNPEDIEIIHRLTGINKEWLESIMKAMEEDDKESGS